MAIEFWTFGKSNRDPYLDHVQRYLRLCQKYHKVSIEYLDKNHQKASSAHDIKKSDNDLLLKKIQSKSSSDTTFILLDERGKNPSSEVFSQTLQDHFNYSRGKTLVFIAGGAYGFSEKVYHLVPQKISLSKLTFPHDLVRLIFMEQLFRAFTILANEKYHNH